MRGGLLLLVELWAIVTDSYLRLMEGLMSERPLSHDAIWYNEDPHASVPGGGERDDRPV